MADEPRVHFPRLDNYISTDEAAMLSFVGCGPVAAFILLLLFGTVPWVRLPIGVLNLVVWVIAAGIFCGFLLKGWRQSQQNCRIRREWAESFSVQIRPRELRERLDADPQRHVLHIGHYGGLHRGAIKSGAVLEDVADGLLMAVHPPTSRIEQIGQKAGVRITRHDTGPPLGVDPI
jgi:hypothetical protein